VHVLIVTDGSRSRAGKRNREDMATVRHAEARAAMEFIGIEEWYWLGLPEGDWTPRQLEAQLQEHITDFSPDIIYAPTVLDYHPEHCRVARCLASIVPNDIVVRVYTLHIPLTHLANCHVDVSSQMPDIGKLLALYESQMWSLTRGMRLRRYAGALNYRGKSLEEFWELSGSAYRSSHLGDAGPLCVRGLRYMSFTDPLSYWRGRAARRAIARLSLETHELR
jgi:LmbE family N-acetylglucosaminyl deacetylase